MSTRLLIPILFLLLPLMSCTSDDCSSSPESLTTAGAKKCLTDMGADITEHAFSEAASADSLKFVKLYIAAGLSTQEPLEDAARKGSLNSVNILLEYGARPNDEMLRRAVSEAHVKVTRVLLEQGIGPNEASNRGPGNLFTSALKHESPEIPNMLLDNGIKLETARGIAFDPAAKAACFGHFGLLDRILKETDAGIKLLQKAHSKLEQGHDGGRMNQLLHENCSKNILSDQVAEIPGI